MTLPASPNPISLSQVNTELGFSASAQITLNDSAVRSLFGKASGAIGLGDGRGKAFLAPSDQSWTGTGIGGTGPSSSLAYSLAVNGAGINQLHIIVWGAGGAGAQWPSGAPGAYGGAGYRVSFIRGQNSSIDALLDSITSITGNVGDKGSYQNGRLPDVSRNGGPGGSSTAYINGTTLLARAKGGNGSRAYWNNGDSNYVYPTNSGSVGDNGGSPGGGATYGGGGGGSGGGGGAGSTYGGNGGLPGVAPGGGGSGVDNGGNQNVVGGQGKVRIIINQAAPF